MTARVLVHADGGACHGTPIVDGRCPKCGIAPDTQSLELWPQPAERRPCAGWVREDGRWLLRCGSLVAVAYDPRPGREVQGWAVEVCCLGSANHGAQADGGYVPTHDEAVPARLAAEDALRAIAAEILRAVGR